MAQAASFTVADRATTPVNHTFDPRSVQGDLAVFAEAGSIPVGEKTFTIRWRNSADRRNVRCTLAFPVVVTETVNGVSRSKVDRMCYIDANFRFDMTTSLQERKDAVGIFANALASSVTMVDKTLTGLEAVW